MWRWVRLERSGGNRRVLRGDILGVRWVVLDVRVAGGFRFLMPWFYSMTMIEDV